MPYTVSGYIIIWVVYGTIENIKLGREYVMGNPLEAINKYCTKDCCCGDEKQVLECPMINCPLYPYRTGEECAQ